MRSYGEWTKKGGLAVLDPGATAVRSLHYDDAVYASLIKAKKADEYFYTRETNIDPPDFYSADAALSGTKITDENPQQKDFAWTGGAKLIEYVGARGNKLQGDLYLPANYEAGKKYPTILYLYEKLTQATNAYPQPGFNGFSISYYTSNGYAVIEPDIEYKVNDPGISSTACVLAALKAAVATGIVDPARVGMQGHSWGGYQTAFAVTQTNAFKAAIAGAPLTDMVSMYSSIYWNTGSTNQTIFENSQGRFTSGYWGDNTEAYIRNSPVFRAQNVQTPLVILSNDKDGAVDHTQAIEYFNTLRRLDKKVIMLEYKGENHGLAKPENKKDYTARMKEYFDFYLMDKPEPKWMKDGVPLLEIKDELAERNPSPAKKDGTEKDK
jgi:dipeptidyl aminopeptidase/acylaminoacyl peptidase